MDNGPNKPIEGAQNAAEGSTPAAVDGDEPCARAGIFTRSCGPDNDWRVMIGRLV